MERSFFGALAASILAGLLGIGALGGLAFVSAAPSPAGPSPKPEGSWQLLDPVTYENITLFPVVTSLNQDTSPFLTLDEGLSTGDVIVSEQGGTGLIRNRDGRPLPTPQYNTGASVNQLVLINRGKRPLVLLAGELVSGGKQDRIIAKDRIVAPGAEPLPLDVFCVEHGRWSSGTQFSAAKTIVHPSVREKAAVDQAQTEVWSAVRSGTTAAAPPSAPPARLSKESISAGIAGGARTEAYEQIYVTKTVGVPIESFVEELQKRFTKAVASYGERKMPVVGVIVAYGGEVAWSDIFASNDLFNHYWSKLRRSYAVEALARPTLREVAARDDAQEFLRRLNGREIQESEPGVYRWLEITEGKLTQIELEALQPKRLTLHRLLLHRTS